MPRLWHTNFKICTWKQGRIFLHVNLTCSSCDKKVSAAETSNEREGNTVPDINLRVTQAFSNIGKGYSANEKFCMTVNVSPFFREHTANALNFFTKPTLVDTWGHTSLIGIAYVIDILTGYVIDFEVMCKVCRSCSVAKRELGESSAEYGIWFEGHRKDCDINHSGSSTSMEMEAAGSSGEDHKHWDFVILPYCLIWIVKPSIIPYRKKCVWG
ncbi:uncharacterized protein TNCV_718061 [Trichonephila clavipes]|nr:uncharacterized protein TNCV_718061 [Trichonephila clavipes]